MVRLGWRIRPINASDVAKTVAADSAASFDIVELRNRTRVCRLHTPPLSISEEELTSAILSQYQRLEITRALEATRQTLRSFFRSYCLDHNIELEEDQFEYLFLILAETAFGAWPLTQLLQSDHIEEITVIGIGLDFPVRVFETRFGWLETNLYFLSHEFFRDLVNKLARRIGRRLSLQTPRINAMLEDGSRLHAAIEPVAFSGPTLTIRRFRETPLTILDLISFDTLDAQIAAFLWMALETDCSILFCGNTGSGKTSTLNALFGFVPAQERILLVEETPELRLPHAHQVRLTANEEAGIGMQSLIVDSLRMRPDRIVVGEVRTPQEVRAFMDTLLAGQGKGSVATFHAQSAREALVRLKALGIAEMDLFSIDLIVVQKRMTRIDPASGKRREERRLTEVCEVCRENGTVGIIPVFEFDFAQNSWQKREKSITIRSKVRQAFGTDDAGVELELQRREKWLCAQASSHMTFAMFFSKITEGAF